METARNQEAITGVGEIVERTTESPNEDRLIMLSDGIFAIATTLLVLDIRIPSGLKVGDFNDLLANGFREQVIIFAITFYVICGYWVSHRSIMNIVKYIDFRFLWINFLFLGFVVFFPVVSNIVQVYNYGTAVVLFTLVLSGCGFTSWVLWFYAIRQHKSFHETLMQEVTSYRSLSLLVSPTYFLASLLLLRFPGFSPDHLFYSWIAVAVIQRILELLKHRQSIKKGIPHG